jgi:protein-disulfide isomerase
MAQSMNLKPFYLLLGVVAVAGGAWIWSARAGGAFEPVEVGPLSDSALAASGWVIGSQSAPVEIVEYADFECGACGQWAILSAPDVKEGLVATGRVRLRFRDFPLPGHPHSPLAHQAAACAGEQGGFWQMADQIFFNQSRWVGERNPAAMFEDYAEALGIDVGQYRSCMDEQRGAANIEAARQAGLAVGVNSTPSFVIGGVLLVGALPYDSIVKYVERAERRAAQ